MPVSSRRRTGVASANVSAEVSADGLLIYGCEQMFETLCARQRESTGNTVGRVYQVSRTVLRGVGASMGAFRPCSPQSRLGCYPNQPKGQLQVHLADFWGSRSSSARTLLPSSPGEISARRLHEPQLQRTWLRNSLQRQLSSALLTKNLPIAGRRGACECMLLTERRHWRSNFRDSLTHLPRPELTPRVYPSKVPCFRCHFPQPLTGRLPCQGWDRGVKPLRPL
jgi:hypothetical protein